jgi:hypothetical protein
MLISIVKPIAYSVAHIEGRSATIGQPLTEFVKIFKHIKNINNSSPTFQQLKKYSLAKLNKRVMEFVGRDNRNHYYYLVGALLTPQ